MFLKVIDPYLPPYFRPPLSYQLPIHELPYSLSVIDEEEANEYVLRISTKASRVFIQDMYYFDRVERLLDKYILSPFSRYILSKNSQISLEDSVQYINFSFSIKNSLRLEEGIEEKLRKSQSLAFHLKRLVEDFRKRLEF